MHLLAAAKINWTLEVLGRRPDGYHEVRTVMQTIDLCDEVRLAPAEALTLTVESTRAPDEDDLALRAARLLAQAADRPAGAAITLTKRIPAGAGLGGGSSDAAAVLRGLDHLWRLGLGRGRLAGLAASLGSDVPFFLHGGTALAQGRGERITLLPDLPTAWLVLLAPPSSLPDKTKRMYQALTAADFGDGSRGEALVRRVRDQQPMDEGSLCNAFERAAFEKFPGLAAYRDALLAAGARRAHLAGAGPALFALGPGEDEARRLAERLKPPGGQVFVARSLSAAAALAAED